MESGYLDSEKFESKNISDKNLVLTKIVNGTSPHRRKSGRCVCNKEQKARISASKTSKQRLFQMNKNWCYLYKLVGIFALHFTYICGPACSWANSEWKKPNDLLLWNTLVKTSSEKEQVVLHSSSLHCWHTLASASGLEGNEGACRSQGGQPAGSTHPHNLMHTFKTYSGLWPLSETYNW